MGDKEISIDVSELNRLEVQCPRCHTGFVISFDDPAYDSRLPHQCSCNENLSALALDAVTNYKRFFTSAVAAVFMQ
jgi:hypothetical protein